MQNSLYKKIVIITLCSFGKYSFFFSFSVRLITVLFLICLLMHNRITHFNCFKPENDIRQFFLLSTDQWFSFFYISSVVVINWQFPIVKASMSDVLAIKVSKNFSFKPIILKSYRLKYIYTSRINLNSKSEIFKGIKLIVLLEHKKKQIHHWHVQ